MRSNTNNTEKSKLYQLLGYKVGIKATYKRRGIIARKAIKLLELEQLNEFEASMPNLLNNRIKVNYMGKSYYI